LLAEYVNRCTQRRSNRNGGACIQTNAEKEARFEKGKGGTEKGRHIREFTGKNLGLNLPKPQKGGGGRRSG